MSYLSFNKKELVNLEYALQREFLGADRTGGYASSTIVCCNTRKYHGLLVLPIENFQGRNHILLSSLDETIIQHGREFNFGVHKYSGTYEPRGHKYVIDFSYDQCPVITYQVGGVVLRKEILLSHNQQQVLIHYTLLDAHSPTKLRLKPFLAFRDIHSLSRENSVAKTSYKSIENGVQFNMYEGFPDLNLQCNKELDFHYLPHWNKNIRYLEEQKRGYSEFEEDLFVPGYFETTIEKGETIVFSAAINVDKPTQLSKKFVELLETRKHRDSFEQCLNYSASQFIIKKIDETRIKSGYHWLLSHNRDTFISLPGIAIGTKDVSLFEKVLTSAKKYYSKGFFERTNSSHATPQYDADTSLWFFWTVQQYEKQSGKSKEELWKTFGETFKEILNAYRNGHFSNIRMDDNGLLWTQEVGEPLGWMKTSNQGVSTVHRSGYLVDINSLWYNAVRYAIVLAEEAYDKVFFKEWKEISDKMYEEFKYKFWNESAGYLADYHNGTHQNMEMRPNQLFACCFDYNPMGEHKRKKVLDKIRKELLTSKGIRTLSPNNKKYKGVIEGSIPDRENAIYNGAAHPWLIGFFMEANFKLYGKDYVQEAEQLLNSFEEDITHYGLCSVAEYYSGNPPFSPYGCITSAKSVGEIIRGLSLIKSYSNKNK